MSDFYMPDELFTKIFTYLPPKSLVRFTCVCKSWKSIITSSSFITNHLDQTKLSNNINKTQLFLVRYLVHSTEERYALHIDNNHTFDQYDIIELPFQTSDSDKYFLMSVLGSCNGLICLSHDYGPKMTVFLWNPSIRKSLTLPLPDYRGLTKRNFSHATGFGFDSRTNDYKVVTISYLKSKKGQSRPRVQLYKLRTESWETITVALDPLCSIRSMDSSQAFVNGAVHWSVFKSDKGIGSLILSFDMSDEDFHVISLPVSVAENLDNWYRRSVAVCGKRLSVMDYTRIKHGDQSCSMWVMKDYGVVESWTKLYTSDLTEGLGKMLGFRRNGELLRTMTFNQLVSYNPRTRLFKYLGVCGTDYLFDLDVYVESLVLLGNDL